MTGEVVRDGAAMIAGMRPALRPGRFVFGASDDEGLRAKALASFREEEGFSLILSEEDAGAAGLPLDQPMRQITLGVLSALDGVGLTAAVASALAARGIACNMVAALRHDHVFVPAERAEEALACLRDLSAGA
jgi:hypothetical protein